MSAIRRQSLICEPARPSVDWPECTRGALVTTAWRLL
jgi:hypothetical protein